MTSDGEAMAYNRQWAAMVIDLWDALKGGLPEDLAKDIVYEWAVAVMTDDRDD